VGGDTVTYLAAGTCVIDANQAGDSNYLAATQVSQTVTVDAAPVFTLDAPPLIATAGQAYQYQFTATGAPAPTYRLHGAPSWLHINPSTGLVTGTPPKTVTPFAYSVTASNSLGTATAGPFIVAAVEQADMAITLTCPNSVKVGQPVTCTVKLTNKGPGLAIGVQTAVTLPSDL
jgi:large repetitive protein